MKTAALSTFALVAILASAIGAAQSHSLAQDEAPHAGTELIELLTVGEPIYLARCKECHGTTGGGFIGPKFVGNDRIANADLVIRQINGGGADMPAFRSKLSPEEIRAVGTYIRNSWGNAYGVLPQ